MNQLYEILIIVIIPSVVVSVGASTLLIPILVNLSRRYKWYDVPNSRKLHTGLIPRIGGIALWLSFLLSFSLGLILIHNFNTLQIPIPLKTIFVFALGITMIHGVGLFDDFSPLRARTKLVFQIFKYFLVYD